MAFDNNAVRAFVRFLIRDPSGRAINDTDMFNEFILPAWRDWWFRVERRPGSLINGTVDVSPFSLNVAFSSAANLPMVETVALIAYRDAASGAINFVPPGDHALTKTDLNRVRQLQQTEAAVQEPRLYANQPQASFGGSASHLCWLYPIPDAGNDPPNTEGYLLDFFGTVQASLSSAGTAVMATDGSSARYVARLVAFNLARTLGRSERHQQAILAGLPYWVRVKFDLDRFMHHTGQPKEVSPLYRDERYWPRG